MKKILSLLLALLLLSGCAATYDGPTKGEYVLVENSRTSYFDDRISYTQRTTYAYDIHGNIVEEKRYWGGELDTVSSYRYDDWGNRISERHWDHSGLIPLPKSSSKTTYDDQNRILTAIYYNAWGQENYRLTYTYDDEANSYTCADSTGTPNIYYLNENGKIVRLLQESLGLHYERIYEYDDRGNHIRTTTYEEGKPYSRFERHFDDQNRQIWEGDYDAAGNLEREISYEYDDVAHTMTIHHSWGTHYSYYDPDGRIYLTEEYDLDGSLSDVIQYTYQQIQVPAEGVETP